MSTNFKEYDELDDFAKNVIDEIIKLGVEKEEALSIFNKYLPVYELLTDDYLEDESFYATQFHDAHLEGFTPEEWLEKIRRIDVMFGIEEDVEDERFDSKQMLKDVRSAAKLFRVSADGGWAIKPQISRSEMKNRTLSLTRKLHPYKSE